MLKRTTTSRADTYADAHKQSNG